MGQLNMTSDSITIPVAAEEAQLLAVASPEERRKLELLLRLRLRELTSGPSRKLSTIMDEMGAEAEARGLTPQILESMLNDE